jgi:hypothetical protein
MTAWEGFMRSTEPKTKTTETLICPRLSCGKSWQAIVGVGHWNFCPHCRRHFWAGALVR